MNKLILKRIFDYVKLREQLEILIIAIINVLLGSSLPIIYGYIIEQVVTSNNIALLINCLIVLIIIAFLEGLTRILQSYLVSKVGESIGKRLRNELYEKIWYLDYDSKQKYGIANIISLINTDIFQVTTFIARFVHDIILQVVTLIIIIIVMCILNLKLALCTMIVIPMFALLFTYMGSKMQIVAKDRQETFVRINECLQEDIKGCSFLQINEAIKYRKKKFEKLVNDFFKVNLRLSIISNITNEIGGIISGIGDVIIIGVGGYLCMYGKMSIGIVIAFQSYTGHLFSPILSLVSLNQISRVAFPSLERIFEFIDLKSKIIDCNNAIELKNKINNISFNNVSLSYDEKENILKDINFEVNKNTMVAIIGESGCGKSSLCNLLTKILKTEIGHIDINDINLNKYSLSSLREKIYMIQQEPIIYKGTIKENILLGENIDIDNVNKAIEKACLHFINNEPIQLNMLIGDDGYTLSGGEKRRLALARALVRNFEVLILDEPTAGLDNITRENLMNNLKQECNNGKIIIIVSHYPNDFKMADNIILIKDGKLYKQGSHKILFQCDCYYRQLAGHKTILEEQKLYY